MRWVIGLGATAAVVWSGWWFAGSTGTERLVGTWLEDRRAEGWVVNYTDLSTTGFPTQFDTTLIDVELADPATGLAISAPRLQFASQAYAPNHLTATFPSEMTVASPSERLRLLNDTLRASLVVEPNTKLTLDSASIDIQTLSVVSTRDWVAAVDSTQINTRQADDVPLAHEVTVTATGVAPSDALRRGMDPTGLLPSVVDRLNLDTQITFDAPWDLDALERRRPQPTHIVLRDVSAVWGGLELRIAGEFSIDTQGIPEGALTVKAVNWRELLAVLQANGTVPQDIGPLAEATLNALANASGRPDTLDAPLSLRGGSIRLGPIPIGTAPRIRLR